MGFNDIFSHFTIGFNVCFILYLVFKYFNGNQHYFYLYLSLLSFAFCINLIIKLNIIPFHFNREFSDKIRSISLNAVVLFFYLFMKNFLEAHRNKFLQFCFLFSSAFIILKIISKFFNFDSLSSILSDLFVFLDLGMLFVILFYLFKKISQISYRFILYGILFITACALMIHFGEIFFNLYHFISYESILNIEVIVGFCFFFLAVLRRDYEIEEEAKNIKLELLNKEIEKQKELEHERERISSDMHDDIGARISAMKLHGEFIKEHFSDDPKLKAELNELLKNTEEMTASMREMIWSLKAKNDFLQNFIIFSQQYATGFFAKSKIEIHFNNGVQENPHINAEVRRNLFLCYKEALNNIYKHSQATQVYITFSLKNSKLKLQISDNGIGVRKNEISHGNGMYNMKTRMFEISGSFEISEVETGTCLQFLTSLEMP